MRSYYCYVIVLLKHMNSLQTAYGNYLIQEILHRLVYFIEEDVSEKEEFRISIICFDILEAILTMASQFACIMEELTKHLYFLISKLQNFLKEENIKYEQAKKLLSILILRLPEQEESNEFVKGLCCLDLFRDELNLLELNEKLVNLKRIECPDYQKEVCISLVYLQLE